MAILTIRISHDTGGHAILDSTVPPRAGTGLALHRWTGCRRVRNDARRDSCNCRRCCADDWIERKRCLLPDSQHDSVTSSYLASPLVDAKSFSTPGNESKIAVFHLEKPLYVLLSDASHCVHIKYDARRYRFSRAVGIGRRIECHRVNGAGGRLAQRHTWLRSNMHEMG